MAYVLVAVGALMAAAGLYVVGYSVLNTRFEEYWASMTAGTTLVAGGIVTLAIGFATRALRDLKTVLAVQSVGAVTGTATPVEAPAPLPSVATEPPREAPAEASTTEMVSQALEPPQPVLETAALRPVAVPSSGPSIGTPPQKQDPGVLLSQSAPADEAALALFEAASHEPLTQVDPHPLRPALPREVETTEVEPATSIEPKSEPQRPPVLSPRPTEPHQMPADWLDRAFADLDQELPISAPALRKPRAVVDRRDLPARVRTTTLPTSPSPEPAEVPVQSTVAAQSVEPARVRPTAPEPPPPAVIGRYEADGTSYVMYADGSIEAQSAAGVYRFKSMAELRSFIEN